MAAVTPKRRLLFVSHEASRTGAVHLLLHMQHWLREHTPLEFETLLMRDGELVEEFTTLGPVHEAYRAPPWAVRARRRGTRLLARTLDRSPAVSVGWASVRGRFDVVYSNTGVNGRALALLRPLADRVVSHIHEMPLALARYNQGGLGSVVSNSDCFIAVSDAVAQGLQSALGVPADKIITINGFVPAGLLQPPTADVRAALRVELGVPPDAWLLGVCGSGHLHKGFDLLPRLATHLPLAVAGAQVHLVHVGQLHWPFHRAEVARDLELLGQAHRVHLLPPRPAVHDLLGALDLHLLPSREDSFPLTVLESAAAGVPTVCFADAGGAPEFCAGGAGVVVPYLDLAAMAQACQRLLEQPEARAIAAQAAQAKVRDKHTPEAVMPQLVRAAGLS